MHIRKLVKSGLSSLVLAVPQSWIKKNSLKPGDQVFIDETENSLIISTHAKKSEAQNREKVIDIDGKPMTVILKEIVSAYINDYQHIILKGNELPRIVKDIKREIISLIALEVIEEHGQKITARSFLNLYDLDMKSLIRRMDNIVRSMILDTKTINGDPQLAVAINERDLEVNRLHYVILKVLKAAYKKRDVLESLGIDEMGTLRYWDLNMNLERIGDRVKNIASAAAGLKTSEQPEFVKLISAIYKLYEDVLTAFYNQSEKEAIEASLKRDEIMKQINKFIQKGNNPIISQIAVNAYNMASNLNDVTKIVLFLQES